ncbi:MAG: LuxR C-terminal-related transcriptional regulator [Gammaproteobacteria bacterium]
MMVNCYSKDINGIYLSANHEFMDFALINKINDIIGKNDLALPWAHTASQIMENDAKVIKTSTTHVFIEHPIIKGKQHIRRCFKSPLLGHHGKIIGILGMSFPVENNTFIPLTPQQTACLKELALGSSIKQIAKILGLSPRTVEHYLNAIKIKLNCKSRSELIMQAIARGLTNPLIG